MTDHSKPTASPAGQRAFQAAAWISLGVVWLITVNLALGLAWIGLGLLWAAYAGWGWRDQRRKLR